MKKINFKTVIAINLALIGPGWGKPPQLEEIVVTAEKRSASIQDVAMTVNAISGEKLAEQAIFDFKQLQELTPGLQLDTYNPRSPVAVLRGIAYDPDSAAASAVDMYFNEIPIVPYVAFQTMFDVGQIEVLRGPQGTLRGRTSPGGAITIVARRPNLVEWEAEVSANVSDNDLENYQAAVSVPIIEDRLGIRIAGLSDRSGGEGGDNITTGKEQRFMTKAHRIVLQARPLESLNIVYTHQDMTSTREIYALMESVPGSQREPTLETYDRHAVSRLPGKVEVDVPIQTLEFDWEVFGDHTLSLLAGRVGGTQRTFNDLDIGNAWPAAENTQLVIIDFPQESAELRFGSAEDGWFSYMVGAYFEHSEGDVYVNQLSHAALTNDPDTAPLFSYNQEIVLPLDAKQKAVFARVRVDFLQVFTLEVGARKSKQEAFTKAIFNARNHPAMIDSIPPLTDIQLIPEDQQLQEAEPTTGSATLSWRINEDFMAYINYGRSFRPGGVNLGAPNGIDLEYLLFNEEFSDSMELGFKSDWLDQRLRINAAVFHQTFDGYIARSDIIPVDVDRNGQQDNAAGFTYNADAVTTGAEAEIAVAWTDQWQASLNLSYAKAVFDDATTPCAKFDGNGNPQFTDENGNAGEQVALCSNDGAVGNAPRFSAGLTSEYVWPLTSSELFARGLFKYNGERELSDASTLPGYSFLNLFAGVRGAGRRWEAVVWAKNLFDKEALTNRGLSEAGVNSDGTPFGTPGNSARFDSGYIQVSPIQGREVGFSFRYSL